MSPCYRESLSLLFFTAPATRCIKFLNLILNTENEINLGLNPQNSYICTSKLYSELRNFICTVQ